MNLVSKAGLARRKRLVLNFIGNMKILSDSFNHFVWRPGATQPTQRIKKKWSEVFNELRALFFLSFFLFVASFCSLHFTDRAESLVVQYYLRAC